MLQGNACFLTLLSVFLFQGFLTFILLSYLPTPTCNLEGVPEELEAKRHFYVIFQTTEDQKNLLCVVVVVVLDARMNANFCCLFFLLFLRMRRVLRWLGRLFFLAQHHTYVMPYNVHLLDRWEIFMHSNLDYRTRTSTTQYNTHNTIQSKSYTCL